MAFVTKNKHTVTISVDHDVYYALHENPHINHSSLANALLREIMEQKGILKIEKQLR